MLSIGVANITKTESLAQRSHSLDNLVSLSIRYWTSLVAQMVKNVPSMQETWVQSLVGKIPCRRKWQLTPVILPRRFPGQKSLVGYSPRGHKESDMTEHACTPGSTSFSHPFSFLLFPLSPYYFSPPFSLPLSSLPLPSNLPLASLTLFFHC